MSNIAKKEIALSYSVISILFLARNRLYNKYVPITRTIIDYSFDWFVVV